jgi:Leucine-rich repeat (LRR) protein
MTATNLPALQELSMDENVLGGAIPAQFFSAPWTALGNLRLDENQLTGQPSGFNSTNFPALFRLELGNNQWAGGQAIPTELGTLTGLTVLDLSQANFNGAIPGELGLLQGLTRLEMNENSLAGAIPTGFIFPAMTVPGSLTLFGQAGCLTATGNELLFVQGQDPLWNNGCP